MCGIVLRLRAWEKEVAAARKEFFEIALRLEIQSIKTAELVEEAAPNDQNIFVRRHGI